MKGIETVLKIHRNRPICVNLPNKIKLEVVISNIIFTDNDPITKPYYFIDCSYVNTEGLKIFTKKIINHYIKKDLNQYLKIFSIDGNLIVNITDIYK